MESLDAARRSRRRPPDAERRRLRDGVLLPQFVVQAGGLALPALRRLAGGCLRGGHGSKPCTLSEHQPISTQID